MAAAEDVDVEVVDALRAVLPVVDDEPVALAKAESIRDLHR